MTNKNDIIIEGEDDSSLEKSMEYIKEVVSQEADNADKIKIVIDQIWGRAHGNFMAGMLVTHRKFGLGKIQSIEYGGAWVSFLFYWPNLKIEMEELIPIDANNVSVNYVSVNCNELTLNCDDGIDEG